MTQRPDLFGAALPAVGVMDMLRFQKFTIGWAWVSDYGSSENPEDFKALYAYSPLHNIKPGRRIRRRWSRQRITTIVSGRATASSSRRPSGRAGGSAPILIRIETKAGHGAGSRRRRSSKRSRIAGPSW